MEQFSTQTCPHCKYEVDDSQAEWEEGTHTVECENCHMEYSVEPIYKFFGFEINKVCGGCGEIESECYCEVEEESA